MAKACKAKKQTIVQVSAPTATAAAVIAPVVVPVTTQAAETTSQAVAGEAGHAINGAHNVQANPTTTINQDNAATIMKECQTVMKECELVLQKQQYQVNTKVNSYMLAKDDYVAKLQSLHGMTKEVACQYILHKIHTKQTFDVYKKLFMNGRPEEWAIVVEDAQKQRILIKVPDGDPIRDFGAEQTFGRFHGNMRNSGLGIINYNLETRIIDQDVHKPDYENRAAFVMDELQMGKVYDYALTGNTPKERAALLKNIINELKKYD